MIPVDWVAHRRSSDRQTVGYVAPAGDLVVVTRADSALVVGVPQDARDRLEVTVPTDRLRPA